MAKKPSPKRDLDAMLDEGIRKVTNLVSSASIHIGTKLEEKARRHAQNAVAAADECARKRERKGKKGASLDSAEAFAEESASPSLYSQRRREAGAAEARRDKQERVVVFDTGDLILLVLGIVLSPIWLVIGIFYAFGPLGYALTRLLSAISMSFYAITQAMGGNQNESLRAKRIWADVGAEWSIVGKRVWIAFTAFSKPFGLSKLFTHAGRSYEAFKSRYESYVTAPADEANTPESFRERYHVVDQLPSGGSSARVYVVRPVGAPPEDLRVLKYFDLSTGAHLESLVREENAVKLSRRLNLISDSNLDERSFWYVMPYYKGTTMTRGVLDHFSQKSPPIQGYESRALGWVHQLLQVIAQYHDAGILHKDIKPDNLIIKDEFVYLIDIGLLTELSSDQQLTTHGTEYFRDPEMVKLALRGERVRDVSAHKFDIYSIGAVLFFLLDGEFPTNGPLSRMDRKVPRAVQMIVSKAMGPLEKRYADARQMLADIDYLCWAESRGELANVRPTDLPSFRNQEDDMQISPPKFDGAMPPQVPASYYPPVYAGARHLSGHENGGGRPRMTAILVLLILCTTAIVIVGLATFGNTQSKRYEAMIYSGGGEPGLTVEAHGQLSEAATLVGKLRGRFEERGFYLYDRKSQTLNGSKVEEMETIQADAADLIQHIADAKFWSKPEQMPILVRAEEGAGPEALELAARITTYLRTADALKGMQIFGRADKHNFDGTGVLTIERDRFLRSKATSQLLVKMDTFAKAYPTHVDFPLYYIVGRDGDVTVLFPGVQLDYYVPLHGGD